MLGLLTAVTMSVLVVASFVIGTISVMATGKIIWIIIWFAGIVSAGVNVYYAMKELYRRLTSDQN
jgi:hypothetical protein